MARIRSVHPGLFTDEAFVGLTADAQVFLIGLWTEADDQGLFEWKPITLRMRLRPTKDGSIDPLLAELSSANCIRKVEIEGRQLGAIRNFRKYQRPKSPNALYPITDEIRIYVGLSPPISEIQPVEPDTIPRKGEIAPQMEGREGGEERKKISVSKSNNYAFEGKTVRLNASDLADCRKNYSGIVDIEAELRRIDAGLAGKTDWFMAMHAMLNAKHQKILGERKTRPGGVTPLGVGG